MNALAAVEQPALSNIEEEAAQFALSFGPDLKVVNPPALRERVLAAARAIPAVYEVEKSTNQEIG